MTNKQGAYYHTATLYWSIDGVDSSKPVRSSSSAHANLAAKSVCFASKRAPKRLGGTGPFPVCTVVCPWLSTAGDRRRIATKTPTALSQERHPHA
jgi:hypothetical protein